MAHGPFFRIQHFEWFWQPIQKIASSRPASANNSQVVPPAQTSRFRAASQSQQPAARRCRATTGLAPTTPRSSPGHTRRFLRLPNWSLTSRMSLPLQWRECFVENRVWFRLPGPAIPGFGFLPVQPVTECWPVHPQFRSLVVLNSSILRAMLIIKWTQSGYLGFGPQWSVTGCIWPPRPSGWPYTPPYGASKRPLFASENDHFHEGSKFGLGRLAGRSGGFPGMADRSQPSIRWRNPRQPTLA